MLMRITNIEENMKQSESDVIAKMDENCNSDTVQWACKILLEEFLKHSDLYNAFVCSIESSLKEQYPFQPERETAEKILKRIIGEE